MDITTTNSLRSMIACRGEDIQFFPFYVMKYPYHYKKTRGFFVHCKKKEKV
jgi:hypothetical protein